MNSTALIVLEKGVYAVIADVIEEMALEDNALLTLERHRMMTKQPIHPLADIHSAFALLVPAASR